MFALISIFRLKETVVVVTWVCNVYNLPSQLKTSYRCSLMRRNHVYATASALSDGLLLFCVRRDANNVIYYYFIFCIILCLLIFLGYCQFTVHESGGALGGVRMVEDSSSVAGRIIDTAVSLRLVREAVREQRCKDNCMVIVTIYKPLSCKRSCS
ncbi:hypothetical protein MKW92_053534 [Papaver armeniacum]|nr:hypothetical protein MKW92_053534 [Papaver armeniacum]